MKSMTYARIRVCYDQNKSGARMPLITTPRKAWIAGAQKTRRSGLEDIAGKRP